jgi:hypothetical protein
MNLASFGQQFFFGFFSVFIRDTTVYRADFLTSFFAVEPNAFRAEIGVDVIDVDSTLGSIIDCLVRALRFTNTTVSSILF